MQRPSPRIDFFVFLALFLFVIGCVEETIPAGQAIDFASEVQALESVYAEAGLSSELIQRVDSEQLLESEERTELNSKLSALEQKLQEFLLGTASYQGEKEKSALVALIEIELSRVNYLRAMVELKDSEKFGAVAGAFESFDFNDLLKEDKCFTLKESSNLKDSYLEADACAEGLNNQIRLFGENFSEFRQTAKTEQKKPLLGKTGILEFIECSELVFEGCSALVQSTAILSEMEQAAGEENLCFALGELQSNISSLDSLALKLDSISEKASSLKALGLEPAMVEEERKALLSISSEFKEFEKQLKKECE